MKTICLNCQSTNTKVVENKKAFVRYWICLDCKTVFDEYKMSLPTPQYSQQQLKNAIDIVRKEAFSKNHHEGGTLDEY